jgi:hypothetical protein
MSDPPVGWQKVWFFLRNDTDVPLPMVTSSRRSPTQVGVRCGPERHPQDTEPVGCCQTAATGWVYECGPPAELSRPPRPTSPPTRNDYVDVSRVDLP